MEWGLCWQMSPKILPALTVSDVLCLWVCLQLIYSVVCVHTMSSVCDIPPPSLTHPFIFPPSFSLSPFSDTEVKGAEELTSPVTGTSKQQQTTGEHLSVCLYVHTSACVLDFINIPDIYMSVGVDLCTCVHVHVCMPLSIFPTCLFTPFLPLCGCRGQRCRRGSFYL